MQTLRKLPTARPNKNANTIPTVNWTSSPGSVEHGAKRKEKELPLAQVHRTRLTHSTVCGTMAAL
jgi:hypothetical protein